MVPPSGVICELPLNPRKKRHRSATQVLPACQWAALLKLGIGCDRASEYFSTCDCDWMRRLGIARHILTGWMDTTEDERRSWTNRNEATCQLSDRWGSGEVGRVVRNNGDGHDAGVDVDRNKKLSRRLIGSALIPIDWIFCPRITDYTQALCVPNGQITK